LIGKDKISTHKFKKENITELQQEIPHFSKGNWVWHFQRLILIFMQELQNT